MRNPFFKRSGFFYFVNDDAGRAGNLMGKYIRGILKNQFSFQISPARYAKLDSKKMIARFMKTFNGIITGQESIGFHREFLIAYLHYKGSAQVNDISIADVGKLGVGKTIGILFPQLLKTGFPKKINEMRQTAQAEECGDSWFQNGQYEKTRYAAWGKLPAGRRT